MSNTFLFEIFNIVKMRNFYRCFTGFDLIWPTLAKFQGNQFKIN